MTTTEELEELYNDIKHKGEYLRDYTYSEYDHCFNFANRLYKIIERIKENTI